MEKKPSFPLLYLPELKNPFMPGFWLFLSKTPSDECLSTVVIIHSLLYSRPGLYQMLRWESGKVATKHDTMMSLSLRSL